MQQFQAIPSLVSFERTSMTTCWDMPGISRMGRFEKRMLWGFKAERHKAQKPMTLNDSMTLNVLFHKFFPSTRDSDKIQKISTKQHSRNSSSWNLHSNSTRPMPLHLARCWWLLAGGVGEGLQGSTPWNSSCAVCNNCTVQRPSRPRRTNQASSKRVMRFKIHPDGILVAWNLVKELHVVVFRKPPCPQMTSGCSASGKCLHRQALMCTSVVDLRM